MRKLIVAFSVLMVVAILMTGCGSPPSPEVTPTPVPSYTPASVREGISTPIPGSTPAPVPTGTLTPIGAPTPTPVPTLPRIGGSPLATPTATLTSPPIGLIPPTPTSTPTPTPGYVHLSILPSEQTVSVGQRFTVTIQVNAGTEPLAGIDALIDFDPAYLEVVRISGGTTLPLMLLNEYDNEKGQLAFSAGVALGGTYASGTFTYATIEFQAKAPTAGTTLAFSQTDWRHTMAAYRGYPVTGDLIGAKVVIW